MFIFAQSDDDGKRQQLAKAGYGSNRGGMRRGLGGPAESSPHRGKVCVPQNEIRRIPKPHRMSVIDKKAFLKSPLAAGSKGKKPRKGGTMERRKTPTGWEPRPKKASPPEIA